MKNLFQISLVVLAVASAPVSVLAQDDSYPDNVKMPQTSNQYNPYNSTTTNMSNEDIGKLIQQTLQYNATAGDQDGQIISNGKVVNLSGEIEEEEPPKKYRYDKELDNPLKIKEPPRLFNNIPYPY